MKEVEAVEAATAPAMSVDEAMAAYEDALKRADVASYRLRAAYAASMHADLGQGEAQRNLRKAEDALRNAVMQRLGLRSQ